MSNEFNGTVEFHETSTEQNQDHMSANASAQSDRLERHTITIPAQSDRQSTTRASTTTLPSQSDRFGTITTQSDRLEQRPIVRPDATSGDIQNTTSTHEDFDLIVENCRRGRTTKSSATKTLLESVERLTSLSANTREKTFVSYLAEINSIEREPAEGTVPNRPDVTNSGTESETEKRTGEQRQPTMQEETANNHLFDILSKRPTLQRDLDDDNVSGPKRQRLGQSDMPWHGTQTGRGLISQLISCNRTCKLLELYREDLARSKFLIRTACNSPEGIQASQWERILRGETLNLNHFLSSLVRTQVDEDRKARIGETHLSFSTSEAKRKVRNAADWATAWQRASEAVAFAFPHQREELDLYQRHIQVQFDAKQPHAHQRIISYDIAVRNYVGGGQTTLLTDQDKFAHLYSAIVLPDGIEFASASSNLRKTPTRVSKSTEICNKFNTHSGCPHNPCRYRHACKKCGGDHSQCDCDNALKK